MAEDFGVGIYKISLRAFPKVRILYVGQSKYLRERMMDHKRSLSKGSHLNIHLQNIYNKHGMAGMVFETICNCNISELDALEQFYIDELKPECNIVRDVKNHADKFVVKQDQAILDTDVVGLELDWKPKPWHRIVYGCGRE